METMSPSMISIAGGSQPLSIVQPYLAITLWGHREFEWVGGRK
jgi:microcystin-dependent protein